MTLSDDRRSWAKPTCPRCKSDVMMEGARRNDRDLICYGCGRYYDYADLEDE